MIKQAAIAALAFGGATLSAPAQAQTGRLCGFLAATDPTVQNGQTQSGILNGGPVSSADADALGEAVATISLKCTIQVGAANANHDGADAASAAGNPSLAVAYVNPTLVSFVSPPGQPVYLCSQVTVNGQVRYYNPVTAAFSVSPNTPCLEAMRQEVDPSPSLLEGLFATISDTIAPVMIGVVDPVLCPVLDGPLDPFESWWSRFWDCPPYDD